MSGIWCHSNSHILLHTSLWLLLFRVGLTLSMVKDHSGLTLSIYQSEHLDNLRTDKNSWVLLDKKKTFQMDVRTQMQNLALSVAGSEEPQVRPWQESQSQEILNEKWLLVFSLELEKWIFMCPSPLDFQDFEKTFLFLLSFPGIFIMKFSFSSQFCRTISLSPLDFQDFQR